MECIISPYVGATASSDRLPSDHSPIPAGTTTATSLSSAICNLSSTEQELYLPPHGNSHGVTPAAFDTAGATVVLPDYAGYAYGRYVLGPAEMSGSIIKTAAANLNSQTDQWEVDMTLTAAGSTLFNKYAAAHYQCYVQDESNPPYCALEAIELDATVESAPAIEAAWFNGAATINGSTSDPFTAQQASDLALVLSYGSLPVRFVVQSTSTITPASPKPTPAKPPGPGIGATVVLPAMPGAYGSYSVTLLQVLRGFYDPSLLPSSHPFYVKLRVTDTGSTSVGEDAFSAPKSDRSATPIPSIRTRPTRTT